MKPSGFAVLPGCLLVVAAFVSSGNLLGADGGLKAPPTGGPPPPGVLASPDAQLLLEEAQKAKLPAPASWKFKNEQHWIVDSIGRDIAEMMLYARHANAPGEADIELPAANKEDGSVVLITHLWDPKSYAPSAKAMIDVWKLHVPEQKTPTDSKLLKRLSSDSLREMVAESRRVSKEMSLHPLDAELHEQAALILGSFGLREAAGTFADTRPTLCRMSAHLAMARALREKPGVCGQVAEAIVSCLVNRQKETLEKIALFPKEQSAWAATLRMRATGDWRVLAAPEKASFIEQTEHARALSKSVEVTAVREFLAKMNATERPEWSRIVMEHFFGVENGHVFVKGSIVIELDDLKKDWEQWSGKGLDDTKLAETLNEPPTRAVVKGADGKQRIEVLSWGDLAAFHQRHLCQSIDQTLFFLRRKWGVPDYAKQFESMVEGKLSGMRLYPFARLFWIEDKKKYASAIADVVKVCTEQPELVTPASWHGSGSGSELGKQFQQVPDPLRWFSPALPADTAYDFASRHRSLRGMPSGRDAWEKLKEIAPYEPQILQAAGRYQSAGKKQTVQQMEESLANISAYNIEAMQQIAALCKDDPKEYLTHMRKACDLRPDLYLSLARYLVGKQMPAEASYAYQAAFEHATDRIAMANDSEWIVNYYFENGRQDDAVKIATDAAEVYSSRGLKTMARLMERMNKLDEAEKYFGNIMERYQDSGPLTAFCFRHKDAPKFDKLFRKIVAATFPDGMKKVTIADFTAAPTEGVNVDTTNENTDRAGLKRGDVFVALDGYRVQNTKQYMLVRELTEDPKLNLFVWNGTKYVEVAISLPNRMFNNAISNFRFGGR